MMISTEQNEGLIGLIKPIYLGNQKFATHFSCRTLIHIRQPPELAAVVILND